MYPFQISTDLELASIFYSNFSHIPSDSLDFLVSDSSFLVGFVTHKYSQKSVFFLLKSDVLVTQNIILGVLATGSQAFTESLGTNVH